MKILVATDGSRFSQTAIKQCFDLIRKPAETTIKIISVVDLLPPVPSGFFLPEANVSREAINEAARKQADQYVAQAEAEFQQRFPGTQLQLATKVVVGSPKQLIVEEAEEWNADLIVVGSHGRNFWDRMFLGSVSTAVVQNASCSVFVARENV